MYRKKIYTLNSHETSQLDPDRLIRLRIELGNAGAEDAICRALEKLAADLARAEALYRHDLQGALRKTVHGMIADANRIGLVQLARIAGDVVITLDRGDHTACGATFARLMRNGEQALCEIWHTQDLWL